MIKDQLGCSFANYYFGTRNEMNNIRQMVHHYQDGIKRIKR
jgi:hypothetical protein